MKANRDKVNQVKEELKEMYPEFSGFIEHTLVATMCKEYHEAKVKNSRLDVVSVCRNCKSKNTYKCKITDVIVCKDCNAQY